MKNKVEVSNLGNFNLKINYPKDLLTKLTSTHDIDEQKKILLDTDLNNIDFAEVVESLKMTPGSGVELYAFIMDIEPQFYIQSLNIESEAIYINNFKNRIDREEDAQTKRGMYASLQDILDKKYMFLKDLIQDRKPIITSFDVSENVSNMYKNLIEMFKNHKRTLITAGKIYPMMYSAIEDEQLLKTIITEQIADTILDNISPKYVFNVLWKYIGALDEYGLKDLDWLSKGEAEHYIKKVLYGLHHVMQLKAFLTFIETLAKSSVMVQGHKDLIHTVVSSLSEIIKESISDDITIDKDVSYMSLEELFQYLQSVASDINVEGLFRDRVIGHRATMLILNDVAEYINSYMKMYANSTMYIDNTYADVIEEFITLLLFQKEYITTEYTHIIEFVDNCKNIINTAAEYIEKILNTYINSAISCFKQNVKDFIANVNVIYNIGIITTTPHGFITKDGESISYFNVHDPRVRNIRARYGHNIGVYMYDPRFAKTNNLIDVLYALAQMLKSDFNGDEVYAILDRHIFVDRTNISEKEIQQSIYNDMYKAFTGIDALEPISVNEIKKKLAYIGNCVLSGYNKVSKEPIPSVVFYSPLDLMYDASVLDILVNNNVETIEDENPMFLENLDFSSYDFGDTIPESETVETLYLYELLNKIQQKKVNILFTDLRSSYKVYIQVFNLMDTLENV